MPQKASAFRAQGVVDASFSGIDACFRGIDVSQSGIDVSQRQIDERISETDYLNREVDDASCGNAVRGGEIGERNLAAAEAWGELLHSIPAFEHEAGEKSVRLVVSDSLLTKCWRGVRISRNARITLELKQQTRHQCLVSNRLGRSTQPLRADNRDQVLERFVEHIVDDQKIEFGEVFDLLACCFCPPRDHLG